MVGAEGCGCRRGNDAASRPLQDRVDAFMSQILITLTFPQTCRSVVLGHWDRVQTHFLAVQTLCVRLRWAARDALIKVRR
jgi:hypothetical protein